MASLADLIAQASDFSAPKSASPLDPANAASLSAENAARRASVLPPELQARIAKASSLFSPSAAAAGAAPVAPAAVAPTVEAAAPAASGVFGAAKNVVGKTAAAGGSLLGKLARIGSGLQAGKGLVDAAVSTHQTGVPTAGSVDNIFNGAAGAINPVVGAAGNLATVGRNVALDYVLRQSGLMPQEESPLINPVTRELMAQQKATGTVDTTKLSPASTAFLDAHGTAPANQPVQPAAVAPAPAPTQRGITTTLSDPAEIASANNVLAHNGVVPAGTGFVRNNSTGAVTQIDARGFGAGAVAPTEQPDLISSVYGDKYAALLADSIANNRKFRGEKLDVERQKNAATLSAHLAQVRREQIKPVVTTDPNNPLAQRIVMVDTGTGQATNLPVQQPAQAAKEQDITDTMAATKLPRAEVLKRLKDKGYQVPEK